MKMSINTDEAAKKSNGVEEENEQTGRSDSWTNILILAALLTMMGSTVPVGFSMGVINTPANIIKNFCNASFYERYGVELTESSLNILWSSIVSTFLIGGMIGSSVGGLVADKVGRKFGLYITNGIALLGAVFFIFSYMANSVEMLFIGRLLVGFAGGLTTSIVPMYLLEISPLRLKGSMGATLALGITSGLLISQIMGLESILGREETWHYLLALFGILIIVATPFLLILPESPKYLFIVKDDYDEAVKSLCRINKKEIAELQGDISDLRTEKELLKNSKSETLSQSIRSSNMLVALLLVCFMQAGQQTSGINAVFYYSYSIFKNAHFSDSNAELATIGTGLVNVSMSGLSLIYVAHFGRKILYSMSAGAAAVFLIALSFIIEYIENASWLSTMCIIVMFLYIISFQIGLGPISYFIGSELFDVGPRSAAMAIGSICNWGGNFLVGMTFPSLQSAIGSYSFLLYALSNALLFVFVLIYFPETRGKTSAEIGLHFRKSKQNESSETI